MLFKFIYMRKHLTLSMKQGRLHFSSKKYTITFSLFLFIKAFSIIICLF